MVLGTEGLPPREAVLQLLNAAWASHAVRAMAVLGLADHLAPGPRTPPPSWRTRLAPTP